MICDVLRTSSENIFFCVIRRDRCSVIDHLEFQSVVARCWEIMQYCLVRWTKKVDKVALEDYFWRLSRISSQRLIMTFNSRHLRVYKYEMADVWRYFVKWHGYNIIYASSDLSNIRLCFYGINLTFSVRLNYFKFAKFSKLAHLLECCYDIEVRTHGWWIRLQYLTRQFQYRESQR